MFKKCFFNSIITYLVLLAVSLSSFALPLLGGCSVIQEVTEISASVSVSSIAGDELLVETVDVGQGDCIIIKAPDGSVIMVDAGEKSAIYNIVETFKKYNIGKIDLLIATHPHSDHIGGMQYFVESYPIDTIVMPKSDHSTNTYANLLKSIKDNDLKITEAKPGLNYQFGDVSIDILGPVSNEYDDLNNMSVVFKLTYGDTSFLFMGDAEEESEEDILNSGADLSADVLKAGHHGSSTSTSQEFLDAVSPSIVLVSCGVDNEYGHPHEEFLNRVSQKGCTLLRTDLNGNITLYSNGVDITTETEK
ncbi:MAG: ComEC/Rec2 family competence protein [Eubacteriales bacterium]